MVGHAFHAAALATIQRDTGWDPRRATLIVGTSAGSGVAAMLRAGVAPTDLAARIRGEPLSADGEARLSGIPRMSRGDWVDPTPRRGAPRPQAPWLALRDVTQPWRARPGRLFAALVPEGRHSTNVVGHRYRHLFGPTWPADPMWICALRLSDGARAVFGRDALAEVDVATAVEASSAIPGFFAPVVIDGHRYVDGGAYSPTNADLVAGIGLDAVVVVSPMSARRGALRPDPRLAARAVHWVQLERELAAFHRASVPVLRVEPDRAGIEAMGLNGMDARRMPGVVDAVERSVHTLLSAGAEARPAAVEVLVAAGASVDGR